MAELSAQPDPVAIFDDAAGAEQPIYVRFALALDRIKALAQVARAEMQENRESEVPGMGSFVVEGLGNLRH